MNWIGWAMWWVASAASSASPAADVSQSGAAQGEPINQKATEATGLDGDDEIVLDEEPAASSASAESEEIVLEEEPTQDKPSTFRLPPPPSNPRPSCALGRDLGGCGHRTSRGERRLT